MIILIKKPLKMLNHITKSMLIVSSEWLCGGYGNSGLIGLTRINDISSSSEIHEIFVKKENKIK